MLLRVRREDVMRELRRGKWCLLHYSAERGASGRKQPEIRTDGRRPRQHNFLRQTTLWPGATGTKCETLLRHNGPPANTPLNKRLMTSVRSGRRVPASARRPSRHSAHDHELKPRALARPMNANVSMLGMEEQRWGQHDARPALTARSQRADVGPGPNWILPRCQRIRHRPPGQRFHFLPVDETGLLLFDSRAAPYNPSSISPPPPVSEWGRKRRRGLAPEKPEFTRPAPNQRQPKLDTPRSLAPKRKRCPLPPHTLR